MKFNTTRKFPFYADYYGYTNITSADGTLTTKNYAVVPQRVSVSMTSDLALGGATTVTGADLGAVFVQSRTKMQLDGLIKNILDSTGALMYEGGGEWKITMSAPYLGPNGIQDGYKYRLVQTKGNI
jgi:hypothetical protein